MSRCYDCANADFKTPAQNEMRGFCNCKPLAMKFHYLPKNQKCVNGKFKQAEAGTMAARERFFENEKY